MLDHIGFGVKDCARSKAFYLAALAPLGYGVVMEYTPSPSEQHVGFGPPNRPQFWIGSGATLEGTLHVCFVAKNRAEVDAFYRAAIAAGGKDNGPPGLRPHYHPNYYGAFVRDPDGHNAEAVCHTP